MSMDLGERGQVPTNGAALREHRVPRGRDRARARCTQAPAWYSLDPRRGVRHGPRALAQLVRASLRVTIAHVDAQIVTSADPWRCEEDDTRMPMVTNIYSDNLEMSGDDDLAVPAHMAHRLLYVSGFVLLRRQLLFNSRAFFA